MEVLAGQCTAAPDADDAAASQWRPVRRNGVLVFCCHRALARSHWSVKKRAQCSAAVAAANEVAMRSKYLSSTSRESIGDCLLPCTHKRPNLWRQDRIPLPHSLLASLSRSTPLVTLINKSRARTCPCLHCCCITDAAAFYHYRTPHPLLSQSVT